VIGRASVLDAAFGDARRLIRPNENFLIIAILPFPWRRAPLDQK
jgi:hypothetical protein